MSLTPAVIDALVASGVSVDQLAAAVKASLIEQSVKVQSKRDADAERQRKSRANRAAAKVVSHDVTVTPRDKCDLPPNDIYSNPPTNPLGAKAPCPPICQKVVEAWNDGPGKAGATDAKPLNADRRKALAARIREHGEPAVFDAIANVGRSPFHCGKNDRSWRANIGWLLKSPENFQKALEMTAAPRPALQQTSAGQPSFLAHLQQRRAA